MNTALRISLIVVGILLLGSLVVGGILIWWKKRIDKEDDVEAEAALTEAIDGRPLIGFNRQQNA